MEARNRMADVVISKNRKSSHAVKLRNDRLLIREDHVKGRCIIMKFLIMFSL